MPGFTKQAIKASFLKLLDTYPFRDITVKMIVEDCGINRKSFYYHYQDIPTLLEEILKEQADAMLVSYQSIHSLEECLQAVIERLIQDKKRVLNIYRSVNRDVFEYVLMQSCGYLVELYIDEVTKDSRLSDRNRELVIGFYRGECLGLITDWMLRGMPDNVLENFHQICVLRRGMNEEMLARMMRLEQ